ncbi:hypothetical protein D0T49_07820 [Paludibacter sp. 221]|nr:hypothetical protein [Paludibacter sp. 221]
MLAHVKIFAGNTLARRERGRFFAKPPGGLILQGRQTPKTPLLLTTEPSIKPALTRHTKNEEDVISREQ